MHFGHVYSSPTAGNVTLTPAGVRSSTSGTQFGSTATAGVLTINADPNVALIVSVTGGILSNGTDTILLDTMTYIPTATTTDGSGNLNINTGGSITIAANQPSGTYTGTYTITVNYQ